MKIKHFLPFFLVVAACSSDSNSTNNTTNNSTNNVSNNASNNVSNNSTNNVSNNTSNNVTNNTADMGNDAQIADAGADMSLVDAGADMSVTDAGADMSVVDAAVDVGVDATNDVGDPYANRPIGQCAVNDDCPTNPNGKLCNRLLPGGSCGACDAFNDQYCDDTCLAGTCITTCANTDECPAGLRCTSNGRCVAQACVNDVCPVPMFGCSTSGLCQRIDCSADATICPTNTTCSAGLCIEDRQVP